MTKHASPAAFFDISHAVARLDETELSAWAERSTLAAAKPASRGWVGTAVFWTVIAGLLIARFFIIDPAKLRPAESSLSHAVASTAPSGL